MKQFIPYLKIFKPVLGQLSLGILCGLIYAAAHGAGLPLLFDRMLPVVFGNEQPDHAALLGVCLMIPAIFIIRGVAGFYNTYLIKYCGLYVLEKIRMKVFAKFQQLPLAFFQKNHSGDLLSRINSDTLTLQNTLTVVANDLIKQPASLLATIAVFIHLVMKNEDVMFILIYMTLVPLCVLPIRYVGKKMLKRAKQLQAQLGNISETVSENLTAAKEVRSYNLEQKELDRFEGVIGKYLKVQLKVVKYSNVIAPTVEIITSIGIAVAVYYSARRGIAVENVMPLIMALYTAYDPIKKLGAIHNKIQAGKAALMRLEYIIDYDNTITDPEQPTSFENIEGNIAFEDVVFRYSDENVLNGINLQVNKGTVMALVGPSGSGKSTMINLIPRFYDAIEGAVKIDGVNVKDILLHDLRKQISIVSQDPVLFNDTIRNNILLGNPLATQEEVEEAARKAFAHEFITLQEFGYDTVVGEKGTRLSGGQKQRIAIARAFLKNAPILVLDEATSALDSESEKMIQYALEELVKGKTTIMIAHRFSTLKLAHQIAVIHEGKVDAVGTHEEILQTSDVYKQLYRNQLFGEI